MRRRARARDPRLVLLAGIPLLVASAFGARALRGPGPAAGFRINRAIALTGAGRPDLAWEVLRDVLAERPDDPDAWFRAGRALRALGRPSEAALHFQRAAELAPRSPTFRFERARALAEAGLDSLAAAAVREVLLLRPEHAGALFLLAGLEASAGRADEAVHQLSRALDAGPERPDRFRWNRRLDAVRNDPRFQEVVIERRLPGTFRGEGP